MTYHRSFACLILLFVVTTSLLVGCTPKPVALPTGLESPKKLWDLESFEPSEWRQIHEGTKNFEGQQYSMVKFEPAAKNRQLYVYMPRPRQGSKHKPKSLRCVLVAPGGSNMLTGMKPGKGDCPEHVPYISADCVVIAYSLGGAIAGSSDEDVVKAYKDYTESFAGLKNAKHAFEYAINEIESVDPNQIYVAGHSSAGMHALLFAAHEPRLAGCLAYCPATDIANTITPDMVRQFENDLPGLEEFIVKASPVTHVSRIQCPVYLFGSKEDPVVPYAFIRKFKTELDKTNDKVLFVSSSIKDHYKAMIDGAMHSSVDWVVVDSMKVSDER